MLLPTSWRAPLPTATIIMTAATAIAIPSAVSRLRNAFVRVATNAVASMEESVMRLLSEVLMVRTKARRR